MKPACQDQKHASDLSACGSLGQQWPWHRPVCLGGTVLSETHACMVPLDSRAACRPRGLQRTAVVGVLGGGQLGKMLGLEAVRTAPGNCPGWLASRAQPWLD